MKIGDIFNVEICDYSFDGYGVCKIEGMVVFVAGAIINEKMSIRIDEVKKNFAFASICEIEEASKFRVTPSCEAYGICGGCQLRHMSYQHQLEMKKNIALNLLRKQNNISKQLSLIKDIEVYGMEEPNNYRNKVQIPFAQSNKLLVGYYKKNTHEIVPFKKCALHPEEFDYIIKFINNICNELHISGYNERNKTGVIKNLLLRMNEKKEIMVVVITNGVNFPKSHIFVQKVKEKVKNVVSIIQNINTTVNNVILGDEYKVLYGKEHLIFEINDIKYQISHKAFFQVNTLQTKVLYSKVVEYLKLNKNMRIIDAYCGVGSIALQLAKHVKFVYGIEVVKEAIDDATTNAVLNNFDNTSFIAGKVEDKIQALTKEEFDAIVIDPPRKGVQKEVIDAIMDAKIKKVVYVSCNPVTLARDLEVLSSDYKIENICFVDMFCHTTGIESVVCLVHR